jgi:glycerol-1-phosphate dehydrogenase [NAD(P)+]
MSDVLERLMSGTFPDPRSGSPVPVPIRTIVIDETLAGREADLVAGLELGGTLAVVSDPDTEAALGGRVRKALSKASRLTHIHLARNPEPDEHTAIAIEREGAQADAFIAVGSGTINDLCKYAAARSGKPYAVFATAPSMNGYTSKNASITVDGLKRTLPARLPAGVFMDLCVLAAAPVRLIRAGVGDTMCRSTVQADWLLAHLVRGDPYVELPFLLLLEDEERLVAEPEALLGGDMKALACLARALTLAGLGMTYCGGSYSTSQGEHLISHYVELFGRRGYHAGRGQESYHGEQIGVTTLTMARLQEELLAHDRIQVCPSDLNEAGFTHRYGPVLGPDCWKEFLPKRLDARAAAAMNEKLESGWEAARRKIGQVTRPSEQIRAVLSRLGAPTEPEEVGWPRPAYQEAVAHAAELRNRFTFLDLARDARLLRPDSR